ncbi:DUF86 domain-containing protein [Isoptericola sp. b490]|nr:DUF86 domain-containing protein [Isoptericola sp. b490]
MAQASPRHASADWVWPTSHAIGEAVKALSADLTGGHPEVPWSDIARMRDLIGHHYYKLDAQIVRATIGAPLGALRNACHALLSELEPIREPDAD